MANPQQMNMLRQIQKMQADMQAAQEALADATVVEATVGRRRREGDRDRRTATCVAISIDPSVVDPDDVETLEDLVVAAVTEASRQAQELQQEKLGAATSGLDLESARPRRRSAVCSAEARVAVYEGPVQALIDELGRLPGIGPKSAQRIAFYLLKAAPEDARRLAAAIVDAKERVVVVPPLLQPRRRRAVHVLPRRAARRRASCASSKSRATSSRSSAPASSAAATTCSRARSRRSKASGPSSCA